MIPERSGRLYLETACREDEMSSHPHQLLMGTGWRTRELIDHGGPSTCDQSLVSGGFP